MRVGVVEVGPVIEDIRDDTGMSSAVAGVLTTMVFIWQAVFSIAGIALVRRYGAERLIAISLLLLAAGTASRGALPSPLLLIIGTLPIGVGVALVAIALPGVVKEHYPRRAGAITGAYVSSLSVAAAITALGIVPLRRRARQLALGLLALGPRQDPRARPVGAPPAGARAAGERRQLGRPVAAPVAHRRPPRSAVRDAVDLLLGDDHLGLGGLHRGRLGPGRRSGGDRHDPAHDDRGRAPRPRLSDRGGRIRWIAIMAVTMSVGLFGMPCGRSKAD